MLAQIDDVMVPVTPGPLDAPPKPAAQPVKESRRSRLVGLFLDGVIWFSIIAAADGFARLGSAIYDTLAGF